MPVSSPCTTKAKSRCGCTRAQKWYPRNGPGTSCSIVGPIIRRASIIILPSNSPLACLECVYVAHIIDHIGDQEHNNAVPVANLSSIHPPNPAFGIYKFYICLGAKNRGSFRWLQVEHRVEWLIKSSASQEERDSTRKQVEPTNSDTFTRNVQGEARNVTSNNMCLGRMGRK